MNTHQDNCMNPFQNLTAYSRTGADLFVSASTRSEIHWPAISTQQSIFLDGELSRNQRRTPSRTQIYPSATDERPNQDNQDRGELIEASEPMALLEHNDAFPPISMQNITEKAHDNQHYHEQAQQQQQQAEQQPQTRSSFPRIEPSSRLASFLASRASAFLSSW